MLLPWTFCSRVHTKGANSQTAEPASGSHLFLSTAACQGQVPKGQQLFPLASSMPEPGRGSWLFCQLWADFTSSQSFISYSSPFCLPMAKMSWSQAQNFAFRTWRVQLLVAVTAHVRYQKNSLLNVFFLFTVQFFSVSTIPSNFFFP